VGVGCERFPFSTLISDLTTAAINSVAAPLRALSVGPEPDHIAEVWRRGSVIASWLLDLAAIKLIDPVREGRKSQTTYDRLTEPARYKKPSKVAPY
jgi:hypothetical protein